MEKRTWKQKVQRLGLPSAAPIIVALSVLLVGAAAGADVIEVMTMGTGPVAPLGVADHIVDLIPQSAVTLSNVPTSSWTYGCSATSAGMIFGYYDRTGYANMYTGAFNGGVAPLTNLGANHSGIPAGGQGCSIIATENGYDGRVTAGHVDDYWISYGSTGPDPWEGGSEHTWGDCTADYMGTNQWKWDFIGGDGVKDFNTDGSTALFSYTSATKLFDYIPPAAAGLPQTALCHGLRLFAESRAYTVLTNYTQKTDNQYAGGFSFADYMAEIDAGYAVMVQVYGHSMVGMGYDADTSTIYIHDTWGDYVASMPWGGSYSGMVLEAITVIHLADLQDGDIPEPASLLLLTFGTAVLAITRRKRS